MNDFCLTQGRDLKGLGGTPLPKFPLNASVWGYNLKGKGETLLLRQKEIQEHTLPPGVSFLKKMLRSCLLFLPGPKSTLSG